MPDAILLLGYGNIDRQDDGVAWHILQSMAERLHPADAGAREEINLDPEQPSPVTLSGDGHLPQVDFWFSLQLTPEMAEVIAGYQVVCFIDAHTGNIPRDISFEPVSGTYQTSPFTHHLTPQMCLEIVKVMGGREPESLLLSVRGYEFGFKSELSEQTQILADEAAGMLYKYLKNHI